MDVRWRQSGGSHMKLQSPKLPCTIPKFNRSRYNGHKCDALPLLHRGNHHLLYLRDSGGCDAIGPTGLQVYLGVHAKSIIIGRNLLSMYHKLYSTEVAKLIPVFIDAMRAANSCQLAVRRVAVVVLLLWTRSVPCPPHLYLRLQWSLSRRTNLGSSTFMHDRWHVCVICTHASSSSLSYSSSPSSSQYLIVLIHGGRTHRRNCICGCRLWFPSWHS